jgi:hypothetical protein
VDKLNRRRFLQAAAGSALTAPGGAALGKASLFRGDGPLTAEVVGDAIQLGAQRLIGTQLSSGAWPDQPRYDNGLTPLCALALLHAGCDEQTPALALAMKWLRKFVPFSTYAASLQTMVFCACDPERDRAKIMRNVAWIEGRQHQDGKERGMWAMSSAGSSDHTDNSMCHMAILALHEAERQGVGVSPRVWTKAEQHWRDTQNEDGSWGWGPGYPGSGSMTCAGVAALTLAADAIGTADSVVAGYSVIGCRLPKADEVIERAIEWLGKNFATSQNPGTKFWTSYYLYALERAGRITGRRFIGEHDWFREGARVLVDSQEASGAWPSDLEFEDVADKNVSTCFSLMFLAKGRWPVVVAHLRRQPLDDWNRHRRGLANLLAHLEHEWGNNLTHQVVDIGKASVEDLLESPVLFINGRDALDLAPFEVKRLRQYLDRGGFLFIERCCAGEGFEAGVRAVIRDLFPEGDQQLLPLRPDHPIWYAERPIEPSRQTELLGVDVGCRTGLVYSPGDLSAYWELDRMGRESTLPVAVRGNLTTARDVGMNVLTYATGRQVGFKSPTPVAAPQGPDAFERGKLYVANVLHGGGCNAAPAALPNLLRTAAQKGKLAVAAQPHEVLLSDERLFNYAVLFFHGRTAFELTPAERKGLREYVERGGTIVADAVCSSTEFSIAFRKELTASLPGLSLQPIPPTDPLFAAAFGGSDIARVQRRRSWTKQGSETSPLRTYEAAPELEAVKIEGRYGVVFSPFDIGCALETEPIGCEGYTREDAARIAMNVLLYVLNQ